MAFPPVAIIVFVTAGKPGLGFGLSVLAGVANIILDYVFIAVCDLGIQGAALGTGFGNHWSNANGITDIQSVQQKLRVDYDGDCGDAIFQEAKEDFTLLIIAGAVIGFAILIMGTIWIDKIIYALGASDLLFPYCKDYL